MITAENFTQHEFIGSKTHITKSTNSQNVGLYGTIINETKSMFYLSTKTGIKSIPKNNSTWRFNVQHQEVSVDGSKIQKRSFDRIGGKA